MSTPFETTPFAQDANASAQSRQELQAKLNGLGGLNGRKLSPEAKEKKLREACEGFESIFIQKMWQEMRNTVPKGGLLQGNEERFWQDMYDQELAKSMTSAGGIGLADMMFEQLSRNLVSASRSAVGQSMGGAFTPAAAPLVNMPEEEPAPAVEAAARKTDSIYEGEAPSMASVITEEEPEQANGNVGELMAKAAVANLNMAANMASQAEIAAKNAEKPAHVKSKTLKSHSIDESSGLQLAYRARRDAGDKLGSHAIRPPLNPRKPKSQQDDVSAQAGGVNANMTAPTMNPGSAESLKAALEKARSGNSGLGGDNSQNLHSIVAAVQAQNAMNNVNPAPEQSVAALTEPAESAPAQAQTTRVRFTTNIPQKGKNTKSSKNNDVIRMLNVENVGVNSKAGQGLAAYHAAQEASRTESQAQSSAQTAEAAAQMPISPLTAQSLKTETAQPEANFAIPPLRANDARS